MLSVIGLNKFMRKTAAAKERLKTAPAVYVRNVVKMVLKDLVLNTPQWSGNTAAAWTVVTSTAGEPDQITALYEADWRNLIDSPKFIGDEEAWRVAWARNRHTVAGLRYNSKIKIVNNAPFADELATDPAVEGQLRPGNFIPGDVMAIKRVATKFQVFSNIEGCASATPVRGLR